MIEAYPLYWPEGRPRVPSWKREQARFEMGFARGRDEIVRQVRLLAGSYPDPKLIISTNIPLRRDGLPLANQAQPQDPGVAVYFNYKSRQVCFACDRWRKVEDNIQAIAKTIDALRGIDRWGTGDMIEAAFRGFAALPAAGQSAKPWREVLGLTPEVGVTPELIDCAFRDLVMIHHPDKGGDPESFRQLLEAREQARRELETTAAGR
jgi:hypothetical protein